MCVPLVIEIARLHTVSVERWHHTEIIISQTGFLSLVEEQHARNFRLWHEEDKARNPQATDAVIAGVKRNIDSLNQQRNDLIEQLDDAIYQAIVQNAVQVHEEARLHTETPGSVIDRLSIMALRIYHYEEQSTRGNVDSDHHTKASSRLAVCRQQHTDLAGSLQRLLDDLFSGLARHKTYRQLKMYNDASLNPAIYGSVDSNK